MSIFMETCDNTEELALTRGFGELSLFQGGTMLRPMLLLPLCGLMLMANQAAPQQGAEGSAKAEKKICRSVVPVGTILPKRYCLTRAEWKELADRNENGSAENFHNKPSVGCGKGSSSLSCAGGMN